MKPKKMSQPPKKPKKMSQPPKKAIDDVDEKMSTPVSFSVDIELESALSI
jgi:hypothetical protein